MEVLRLCWRPQLSDTVSTIENCPKKEGFRAIHVQDVNALGLSYNRLMRYIVSAVRTSHTVYCTLLSTDVIKLVI